MSKATLLTRLLPLSLVSFFGTLMAAAILFPEPYHWHTRVISHLLSPQHNPEAYWLPSFGIAAAALLALPFAGYLRRRLHHTAPGLARLAGTSFAISLALAMAVALPFPPPSLAGRRWLHELLARALAASAILGMLCCCFCALRDRLLSRGHQRSLCARLAFCWTSLTLAPFACVAASGILLAGRLADQGWALRASAALRPTVLWQLAFWEWIGAVAMFVFLFGSVLWLPDEAKFPAVAPALLPGQSPEFDRFFARPEIERTAAHLRFQPVALPSMDATPAIKEPNETSARDDQPL